MNEEYDVIVLGTGLTVSCEPRGGGVQGGTAGGVRAPGRGADPGPPCQSPSPGRAPILPRGELAHPLDTRGPASETRRPVLESPPG
jgi:hypothetical protein